MKIQRSTKKHKEQFSAWQKQGSMEEITCREIINGKPFTNPKVISFSFFVENINKPIGKFNSFNINKRNQSCECGYAIDPNYRGKGFGTAMVEYCVSYIFKKYNFNKIYCQTGAFNKASVKILKGLGFHRDGVLRQHHKIDNKLWDDYIFSILRIEWKLWDKKRNPKKTAASNFSSTS